MGSIENKLLDGHSLEAIKEYIENQTIVADSTYTKVATNTDTYTLEYGVTYFINLKSFSSYVTIGGTNYYGAFHITNYSEFISTSSASIGVTGPVGLYTKVNINNQRISVAPTTTGKAGATSNVPLIITASSFVMDVYRLKQ